MTGMSTTVFLDSQLNFKVKCVKPREMYETWNMCNFAHIRFHVSRADPEKGPPLPLKSQKYAVP